MSKATMVGAPGSGKSMLARRLSSILPAMNQEEALASTAIHSVVGTLSADEPLLTERFAIHTTPSLPLAWLVVVPLLALEKSPLPIAVYFF